MTGAHKTQGHDDWNQYHLEARLGILFSRHARTAKTRRRRPADIVCFTMALDECDWLMVIT